MAAVLMVACTGQATDWIRAGRNTNQPLWGIQAGLQFAIHPAGFRGTQGGPRGLLRLGYPILSNGVYDLVNFIAVEPVVHGRRGLSELEPSRLDKATGKRFWTENQAAAVDPGKLWRPSEGIEQLDVTVQVERFDNGAHVQLLVSQRSDAPDEIQLTIHAEPDSAPLENCILTATMGNLARARQLWLKDSMVNSLSLYAEYRGNAFAPPTSYALAQLPVTSSGDLVVAITTDEDNPARVHPFPGSTRWYYGGRKVTQYWKKSSGSFHTDLVAVVNARLTYWQSRQPIPGGVAFENFELRERFYEGQRFIFGMTPKTPAELGISR